MSFQSRHQHFTQQDRFVTTASTLPSLIRRIVLTVSVWRQRAEARRSLVELDPRSLRDIGISPAAAAFEADKPFWRKMDCLR